jgi:hypothetical protein
MEKIFTLWYLLTIIVEAIVILPLVINEALAPNYRSTLATPINTSSIDAWNLLYSVQPNNWTKSALVSLPYAFNGTNGIIFSFNVAIPAVYQISLVFSALNSSFSPNISFGINSMAQNKQSILASGNTFNISFNFVTQTYNFYVWGDNALKILVINVQI